MPDTNPQPIPQAPAQASPFAATIQKWKAKVPSANAIRNTNIAPSFGGKAAKFFYPLGLVSGYENAKDYWEQGADAFSKGQYGKGLLNALNAGTTIATAPVPGITQMVVPMTKSVASNAEGLGQALSRKDLLGAGYHAANVAANIPGPQQLYALAPALMPMDPAGSAEQKNYYNYVSNMAKMQYPDNAKSLPSPETYQQQYASAKTDAERSAIQAKARSSGIIAEYRNIKDAIDLANSQGLMQRLGLIARQGIGDPSKPITADEIARARMSRNLRLQDEQEQESQRLVNSFMSAANNEPSQVKAPRTTADHLLEALTRRGGIYKNFTQALPITNADLGDLAKPITKYETGGPGYSRAAMQETMAVLPDELAKSMAPSLPRSARQYLFRATQKPFENIAAMTKPDEPFSQAQLDAAKNWRAAKVIIPQWAAAAQAYRNQQQERLAKGP